jgi:hypothetical protein
VVTGIRFVSSAASMMGMLPTFAVTIFFVVGCEAITVEDFGLTKDL